ncbi:MAG TPA: glutathione S-transferase family protein [Methylibium sp.]|nr:glutathione S-transferase family protein [Methylibium sp.]
MKLLNSFGPNPRMVRMLMAEKGVSMPFEDLDILANENRQPPYLQKNPAGQTPSLVLDDGRVIAETVAICEYLEELHPTPALVGSTPVERAEARMTQRRVELNVTEYLYNAFRFGPGLALFEHRVRCLPEASAGLKAKGMDGLALIDRLLEGKRFLCGERVTVADLVLYCCLDFVGSTGIPYDPALKNVAAWMARMNERPSASASLSPNWAVLKMRG